MKKKIMIFSLIVVLIIPIIMNFNTEQFIESIISPIEEETSIPQTIYTIPINSHRYWDFGNIISNTHTIDVSFTSNVGIDSWFMTYDDLLRWEANTPPYTKHNIQYDKTSRTIEQWNPDFNEHWVFVVDNTNLVSASVDLTRSTHRTQVEITETVFSYHDSDYDGYDDSLTLHISVSLDRSVMMDFSYKIEFSYKGESMYDNINDVISDTTWINSERTFDVYFNPNNQIETSVSAKITIEINDATWQGDYDVELRTSKKLFYPNYKKERRIKMALIIGIPTGVVALIIVTIVSVKRKKKKTIQLADVPYTITQEEPITQPTSPPPPETIFCWSCGTANKQKSIFCIDCGSELAKPG